MKSNETNQTNRVSENEAYKLIAIAITKQAAQDYQALYQRSLEEGVEPWELKTLERWFTSPEGQMFSFGMGELIVEKIRKGEKVEEWIDEYQAI